MDNNFTIIVSIITAFAAIVAPLITSLIQSRKDVRIAKLNSSFNERLAVIRRFSNFYLECSDIQKTGYISSFYSEAMILVPLCYNKKTRKMILKLANNVVKEGRNTTLDSLFQKCMERLSKEY